MTCSPITRTVHPAAWFFWTKPVLSSFRERLVDRTAFLLCGLIPRLVLGASTQEGGLREL